jgi:predicted O-methyltransferase YrrM
LTKNQLHLVERVKEFHHWLLSDLDSHKVTILEMDDGVAVISK